MSILARTNALLAAVLTLAVGASAASAVLIPLNVNPAGASVATSVDQVTFTVLDWAIDIVCESSTIRKSVLGNGTGTVAAGDARYDHCVGPLGVVMKATNPVQWTLQVVGELLTVPASRLLVGLDFTVPAGGLSFTAPDGRPGACSFTLSGRFTLGKLFAPQALPISQAITPTDAFTVLPLAKQSWTVGPGAACMSYLFEGDHVSKDGTYTLSERYTASQR